MKTIKVKNKTEGSKAAFKILQEEIEAGAKTLGLATGSTPLELYKEIRESPASRVIISSFTQRGTSFFSHLK